MASKLRGGPAPPPTRRVIRAVAAGAITNGYPVKSDGGSPFKLSEATDGDSVYGIAVSSAEAADDIVFVLVEGEVSIPTTGAASWASHRRIVAAGSGLVDQGSSSDPFFATLISHDTTNDIARVYVHADAQMTVGRAIVGNDDTVYPFGTITTDRPLVATGGRIESTLREGTTAQRPGSPYDGQEYFDNDILEWMVYDGTRWRSGVVHEVGFGYNRGAAVTTAPMSWVWTASTADNGLPWFSHRNTRIIEIRFALKGGTGGITWTPEIRKNGSGSALWTGTGRSSTTSWQSFSESTGEFLAPGDRIYVLATAGSSEAIQASLSIHYVYT